jgi:hypothetical protein
MSLTGGPASLAVDHTDLVGVVTRNLLDVGHGTGHVIEVGLVGLVGDGTLPVGEGVGQDVGHHGVGVGVGGEQIVGSAVSKLVPAVGGTNGHLGELLGDCGDVVVQLRAGQIATVEGLGADSDGLDDVLIARDGFLEGSKVLLEGGIVGAHIALVLLADPGKVNTMRLVW